MIIVSDNDKISRSGVITVGVSDHLLTYCTRKIKREVINKHNSVKLRSLKHYSKQVLDLKLLDINWNDVFDCNSVEEAWLFFKRKFMAVIDGIAPVKEIRVKQRTEPWMSSEILHMISERDAALRRFRRSGEESEYKQYIHLRNKIQFVKSKSKMEYFESKVSEYQNKPKQLWQTLKSLGTSSKSKSRSNNIGLNINDELCFDKLKVAENFNTFFTTIASKLVEKLPAGLGKYGFDHVVSFYQRMRVKKDAFNLAQITEDVVLKHLETLNPGKATGLDNLPAKFLRDGAKHLAPPLTHIINLSIHHGKVPNELKTARVSPIYKKNSKTDPGNYRPVSVLSIISKILERVVYNQVDSYLQSHKLLYEFQSGFRSAFSTDTCLIHLTDHIRSESDRGNYTGMVILDLQKAFDTVNHQLLLNKLQAIGFNSRSIAWFKSYLTCREQVVNIGDATSPPLEVTCGVPQGSILGPLIFLIYVNDMPAATNSKLLLYADDSAILVSGKDVGQIQITLSKELESIREWLIDNKLSLHLGKTESILFGTNRKLKLAPQLNIECAGSKLANRPSVKYLGVDLDQSLSGESIARKLVTKTNGKLKFLYRNTKSFNLVTKKLLVSALIQCHFDYASSCWYSGLTKHLKSKIQISQNKVIRYLLNLTPRTHIGANEFRKVNMIPVEIRVNQLKLNHMFKIINNQAPNYLQISMLRDQHNLNTRFSQHAVMVPHVKHSGAASFVYTASTLWNSLPPNLQSTQSKYNFKKGVKDWLFSNYENCYFDPFMYF